MANNFNIDDINLSNTEKNDVVSDEKLQHINSSIIKENIPFVHLHLHTFHSILDGCGSIDEYIKVAKQYNHPAIAITDHGTLSGTFEFWRKCKKAGIKPIIGMEAYVNDNMGDFEEKKYEGGNAHQIILVKNEQGYTNINKLAYRSFVEGFYRRGRIKTDWLFENKDGLIVTTACIASKVSKLLQSGDAVGAEKYFKRFVDEFGEDFYAEIQLNELEIQKRYNSFIIELANKYSVKIIITSDAHYVYPEDAELQDTLIAINQKSQIGKSFKLTTRSLYYTNSNDIFYFNENFGYNYPHEFLELCMKNTLEVADKCNFDFEVGKEKYPKYTPSDEVKNYYGTDDVKVIITKMAFTKLKIKLKKYQENNIVKIDDNTIKKYFNRLNYELKVIDDKKMLDYFMVNWEIIKDYREHGYEVGTARGSAAGSLLSWVLDITKIDPLRFGLYFERFLNPTRNSAPDLDIDYQTGTDHITHDFLLNKYGRERIMSVATFSTFNEKGCLKDVVRAHYGKEATGYDSVVFKVTKEMPDWKKVDYTLEQWFKEWSHNKECSPEVKAWLLDKSNEKILKQTLKLQGQIRGIGQHAAGVVITPSESWNYLPTNMVASKKSLVTAYQEADGSSKDLSMLGILKLDMLKLDTLNIIQESIKIVREKKGVDIKKDIENIDVNNKELYKELRLGLNHGVFQFESPGMNSLIKGMRVENFDEIVAANALYRPGPMGIGAHTDYIRNKFHPEKIQYLHESLRDILEESNGVLIFQEQVMFIANIIGGMSLGEGDLLRRYMDKASKLISKEAEGKLTEEEKNSEKYQNFLKYWNKFIDGAKKNGIDEEIIDEIKHWIIRYSGYSFNKSHCVSYSYIALQTLYLKHYYPTEFYTALLNHPKSSNDKEKEKRWLATTIASAMSKGISIKPPSRKSLWKWTMTGDKEISMGFSGIDGFGEKAYAELEELLRKEKTTFDKISMNKFFGFPFSAFNKKVFEVSVKAGVFDDWSNSREYLLELKQRKRKKTDKNQLALFDLDSDEFEIKKSNDITHPPTSEEQKKMEFIEVCNFDIDRINELGKIKDELAKQAGRVIESILNFSVDDYYFFFVDDIKLQVSQKGSQYIVLKAGDGISSTSIRVFSNNKDNGFFEMVKDITEVGGVYISEFVKNKKGFVNFKRNAKFKRIK